MQNEEQRLLVAALSIAGVGALIGFGKLLQSKVQITWRLAIGRAITTGALSVCAFAVLAWIPDANIPAIMGIGVFLASLGDSAIENIINSYVNKSDKSD